MRAPGPGKVNAVSSNPDDWGKTIPRRLVSLDEVHQELIGADQPTHLTAEYEIMGDEGDFDEDWGPQDAPETAPSDAPSDVVEMGPEPSPSSPGASPPPSFHSYSGPRRTIPRHAVPKHAQVKKSIAQFRSRIKAKDPRAIKALFQLQYQARTSPQHAALLRAIANANVGFHFGGAVSDVFSAGTAHGAVTKILTLALSPVAWATHGVGTISKGIGRQLEHLSRKL